MFLALVMACSLYVEDDCKVFKDTRGFHMTEESCVARVLEMVEGLKKIHQEFEEEIYVLPDSENRFLYKCDDKTGFHV